jgi:hypothetical protein
MESESIVKISINSSQEYVDLVKTIYMFFVVSIVWHVLLSMSYKKTKPMNIGLTGSLFNIDFINFLLTGLIAFLSFFLISKKILVFD